MREPTHYHCSKCGETFPIPDAVIETWRASADYSGHMGFETKEVPLCPYCDADDLQEAEEDFFDPDDLQTPEEERT
jgi:Fe2+ or Zn2+ uptake regulation protein